jgi:ubiquinone biosynthesis protein
MALLELTPHLPGSGGDAPDTDTFAFSEHGPWRVVEGELTWRIGLDGVRRRTHAQVPGLTTPGRLPPGPRVIRTGRVLGGALAAWRLKEKRSGGATSRTGVSRRLRRAFAELGPTYIKMGQIISSGEGIFPPELVAEFRQLRDRVPPEPFAVVRRTVEEELGVPLGEVFSRFDEQAIAAASIAQVHAATLRTGEDVVVKVQRPRVTDLVRRDLRAMSWFAPHLVGRIPIAALANPPALVELFAETIVEELDFRLEADNMLDIARVLRSTNQQGAMIVPRPHPRLVTRRMLVMERVHGFAWDDAEGMRSAGIDTEAVVRAGMIAFLEGVMLHGVFHGDLHGGNLMVLADGRVALLDHGITGRLSEPKRLAFLRLMMAGTTNDIRMQVRALCDLGALPPDTDVEAVIRDLRLDQAPVDPTTMTPDELIATIRDITKALLGYGARMPKELMLYVKDLLFLDGALATLAPNLDLFQTVTDIGTHFAVVHGQRIASDVGVVLDPGRIDITSFKSHLGIDAEVATMTYAQLQDRRALIAKRMEGHDRHARQELRAVSRAASARNTIAVATGATPATPTVPHPTAGPSATSRRAAEIKRPKPR